MKEIWEDLVVVVAASDDGIDNGVVIVAIERIKTNSTSSEYLANCWIYFHPDKEDMAFAEAIYSL